MLVLSRRQGERLVVGRDVEIEVLQVRGRRVRLGIFAPEHVRVLRRELTSDCADEEPSQSAAENRKDTNAEVTPLRTNPRAARQRPR